MGTTTERGERCGPGIVTNYPATMAPSGAARALVTGGSGFVGAALARRLVAAGFDVHVTTRGRELDGGWRLRDLEGRLAVHRVDLRDADDVRAVAATVRPGLAFHLAASAHAGAPWSALDECLRTNVRGTVTLVQALAEAGCGRVVHLSTADVYGGAPVPSHEGSVPEPRSPYAVSKLAAEACCRALAATEGVPVVVLRPSTTYGPGQRPDRLIPEVVVRALRGEEIELTAGRQTREPTYVDDLVEGVVAAACTPAAAGEVLNLGSGEEVEVRAIVEQILQVVGAPASAAHFGALPDRPGAVPRMASDSSRARSLLGWAPKVSLRDGLERTVAWYRERLRAGEPLSTL